MSLLNKGMDMPESCLKCPFTYEGDCTAKEGLFEIYLLDKTLTERHPDCPLVEVHTPHGRLIDVDALKQQIIETVNSGKPDEKLTARDVIQLIENAPTIIEAEG